MNGWYTGRIGFAAVLCMLLTGPSLAVAQTTPDQLIFGPTQYVRTSGAPTQFTDTVTVPPTVGPPFLLHVVNGQSNGQNRISSAWITVNTVQVAGPADFGQNVAIVDRTITLNPGTNQLTVKLASTPGAYLTIRVYGTKILPTPTALTPNPLNLTVGSSGNLTATISPAPTTAGTLSVTSSNLGVATVPNTVPFTANQTSLVIPVTAVVVGNVQITATLNDGSVSATVDVGAAPPTIASLQPASETITQGGTGTLTVTISAAQSSATTVSLSSSASSIASVPASVTLAAGQTTKTIAVSANTPGTAVITASLNGTSATSTVTVTANLPKIVSLVPATTSLNLGATGTLTVTISAVQASATQIPVTVAPTGIVTVPATVTVPAGQLTTTIPVTAVALGTAMVHVSLNGTMAESAVQVTPPPPALVSLLPSPLPVVIGANGTLTVTLNAGQLTNTEVSLTVTPSSIVQVPAIVTVPAGQTSASFTVNGLAVGSATITAALGGTTKTAIVQVQPPPPAVVSLLPNPLPLQQGATGSLTVTINAAQVNETVITLTNSASTLVQVPTSITVPANQLSAVIPVTALLAGSATITASINSSTASSIVQVTPPPPVVASLTTIPPDPAGTTLTRPKGKPGTLRVTLSRAPSDVTLVTLTSSATNVAVVPASVTVAAGSLTADVPVNTVGEGTATITASLNEGTATATVTVTAPELVLLTLSPQELTLFVGETQPMTATATLTDGTTQNLTTDSRLVWSSTNQTVATIASDGLINALAVGASTIRATFTPTTGSPTVVETSLTVLTPPALSLSATPTTVTVGQALTVTVTSARVAGIGGLQVTLTDSGTGALSHASTVTILENQTSATFVITGVTAGSVTLTASAPIRTSGTVTLTVNPGPPNITSITPTSGPVGTVLTITGTSFNQTAANNQITINGQAAIVGSVNATGTVLVTTIPQGATTGAVTVTTLVAPPASGPTFTVALPNFTVTALPTPMTIPALGQGSFAVGLTGTEGFTTLASLSVTGLPTGMTALYSIGTIGAGQSSLLTLTTNGTTPTGTHPITIVATGVLNGVTTPRSLTVNVQVLATGATTFAGQVLDEEDKPVKGALIKIGTTQVTTDDAGNFLMPNAPVGADQVLFIDGGPASTPGKSLPVIPYKVTIVAGQVNVLSFVPHLHFQKTTGMVDISNTGVERIVTDPELPGFQMKIPAGAQIIGWDGQPNTQISVRRVPIDRIPVPPLPAGLFTTAAYMDYFGKPGGGTPSEPIPVTLPNDLDLPPGAQAELWFYDEAPDGSRPNQWAKYGTGTVSQDGSQIVPDIDPNTGKQYGQPRFCCGINVAAILQTLREAYFGGGSPCPGSDCQDGDPVDLSTGQLTVNKTDLVLSGRLPVTLTRAYQTNGNATGPFGRGTTHASQVILLADGNQRTVRLGDGRRLTLTLQADGSYRNLTDAALQGAVLTGTSLRWKDGTRWIFGVTLSGAFGVNNFGLTQQIDRNNNTITNTWSGENITAITGPDGRQLVLDYDGSNRVTRVTDPIARTVQYAYDGQGNLATVMDPDGGVTRYEYDSNNRMTRIMDPRNIVYLQNFYGPSGRLLRQVLADGAEYRFRYQVSGAIRSGPGCPVLPPGTAIPYSTVLVGGAAPCPTVDSWENLQAGYTITGGTILSTTVLDPRGFTTATRFNQRGYPVSTTDALGQISTTVYSASNQAVSTTDALGRVTKFEYDAAGNVKKITDPTSQSTQFEYHPTWNKVTKITDALNQVTEFTYDNANGNLLTTKDPLNHVTAMAYNSFGQVTSVQGPIATEPPTTFAYDTNGNLITVTDPVGNSTQKAYDAVSRLTSVTDPRGLQTLFRYNGLNQVTEIADPRQGLTRFLFDPNGNLLSLTDPKNQTTTYTYDSMDRVKTRTDALGRSESYDYDLAGNQIRFLNRKQQESLYEYDALNRRTRASFQDGTTRTTVYDAVGNVTQMKDSATGAIDWTYDVLDRLTQEVTSQGALVYTYDAIHRRLSMRVNGQAPITYGYDANSQLTAVAQGSVGSTFTHDAVGRRTTLQRTNGVFTSYGYDLASRLTGITHAKGGTTIEQFTYGLDPSDQKTQVTQLVGAATALPPAVTAAYDAVNQQTQFNLAVPQTLAYDANGNLTSVVDAAGTTTYSWDARDRLMSITGPGTGAFFQYDALDRRISKTINGATTLYQYDGQDIVTETGATTATYLSTLAVDEPLVRQTSSGSEYYQADDLGSTIALTDQTGAVTTTYTYGPFGATTVTGSSTNPFQFTGRENDGTGLYYYRARYYSPARSRFIAEDPLEFGAGDGNLYAYVFNNPTTYTDPSGEIVPALVMLCLRGAGQSIADDIRRGALSGRKPDLDIGGAAMGCMTGGLNKAAVAVAAVAKAAGKAGKGGKRTPDFVVSPGGTTYPVPKGAQGPTPVINPAGKQTGMAYKGGAGGANGQVTTMRVMDSTAPRGNSPGYPNGYVKYENQSGQGVNPYTGRTLPNTQSHFPIK
ncbi:MAG: RHS repeat-associated core domain-containing protein [Nitrospira sp.]